MRQYFLQRMVMAAFLTLFVFLTSYSQYVRPSTVVPGSTADQIFNNADRIHREATQKPVSTSKPVTNTSSSKPSAGTNTNSVSGNSNATNNSGFFPSAEAQKAFDDAINQYDEKTKAASACFCNTLLYTEVKFVYSTPFYQKKYGINERSSELFDLAKQLNDIRILSGYLINIKSGQGQIVVVESTSGNGKVWKPYLINWDKYNSGTPLGFEINTDISGPGAYATLTDKLKYIEKAIPKEEERITAENRKIDEAAKNKWEDDQIKKNYQLANIKHVEPYNMMYVQNLEGVKLDIKNYPLRPDEEFVAFFVSEERGIYGNITGKGIIYKVIVGKNGSFYAVNYLNYAGIIPNELLVELAKDPIKYRILERLVNLKIGVIGTYESEKLEQEEKKYFRETISRMENSEKKKAADLRKVAEEKSTFGVKTISSLNYSGNFYGEKMNGIGNISSGGNSFSSGLFTNNSIISGISKHNGNKTIFLYNSGLSSPMPLTIYEDGKKGVNDYKFAESNFGEREKYIYNKETSFFKNGEIYDGDNLENPNAYGIKWFPNGDVYNGYFKDSVFSGSGRYINVSGQIYEGRFDYGVKNGYGFEYDNKGGRVVKYENGKREKKTQNTDNSYYEYRNGNPLFRSWGLVEPYPVKNEFSTGELFLGVLYINPKSFRGTIRLKNGRVVFGHFKLQGNSTTIETLISEEDSATLHFISYPNQDFYYGKMSTVFSKKGMGAYCYANGEVYIGNFSNDQRNDKEGMIVYPNGNVLRATFVNDKIDGFGEYLDAAKKEKYAGNFKEGVRDGEGTLYFADGTSKNVVYKNGVLQQ